MSHTVVAGGTLASVGNAELATSTSPRAGGAEVREAVPATWLGEVPDCHLGASRPVELLGSLQFTPEAKDPAVELQGG